MKVVAIKNDMLQIELSGWRKEKGFGRVINQDFGMNIPTAALSKNAAQRADIVKGFEQKEDDITGLKWQQVTATLWVEKKNFVSDISTVWTAAKSAYNTNCSVCHTQPAENHFDANTWPGMFNGMLAFVNFDTDSEAIVLKYLQSHSSDFSKAEH